MSGSFVTHNENNSCSCGGGIIIHPRFYGTDEIVSNFAAQNSTEEEFPLTFVTYGIVLNLILIFCKEQGQRTNSPCACEFLTSRSLLFIHDGAVAGVEAVCPSISADELKEEVGGWTTTLLRHPMGDASCTCSF